MNPVGTMCWFQLQKAADAKLVSRERRSEEGFCAAPLLLTGASVDKGAIHPACGDFLSPIAAILRL